ncbi:MAG: ARC6/PARC6 family protein [Cyanobacteria bacterium J06639_18]
MNQQNSQHQNSTHKTARANTSQSPNSRNINYRQSQEINNSDRQRFSDHQNSKRQDYSYSSNSYSSRKSLQTNNGNGNGNGNTHRTSVPTGTRERFSREVQSNSNISGSHLNGAHLNSSHLNNSNNTNSGATATSRRQRTRTNSRTSDTHQGHIHQGNLQRPNSGYISVGIDRRIRLLLASVAGVALIFLLGSTAWGWMKNILSPPTAKPEEQLAIAINEPPIKIPNLNKTPESTTGKISKSSAETVIRNWLLAKTRALGQRHDIDSLKQALTGQSLSQWERIVRQEKAANRYRMFQHRLDPTSLQVTPIDEKNASVVASVTEAAKFYQNGQINNRKSYNETIRVKYDLVMVNNAWRIQEMSVLNTVSKND